jgi:hypothetical protein
MSLLSQVKKGKVVKPYFITIFGSSGVGKSSLAAEAPNAIFACTEDGSDQLDIVRFPRIENYDMMLDAINELLTTKHDFKTFVVDSIDHLEPLLWKYVCKKNDWKSLEDGSYGKGYNEANLVWHSFFNLLKQLREKMNVVLICHQQVKSFNDPSKPTPYDRYELKLHKGAAALVKENCDALLFATYETVINIDKTTKKAKAFGGENRVMYTEYRAHHDAKNRFGLPYQLELSWKSFDEAARNGNPESTEVLVSQINGLLSKVVDEDIKGKAKAQTDAAVTANDVMKLNTIKNRLAQIVQEAV